MCTASRYCFMLVPSVVAGSPPALHDDYEQRTPLSTTRPRNFLAVILLAWVGPPRRSSGQSNAAGSSCMLIMSTCWSTRRPGGPLAAGDRGERMTLDMLADADEAAARAATAAGVVVRELETLAELKAAIGVFDQIWAPDSGDSSMRLDLLRAMTKAGNYASGAY